MEIIEHIIEAHTIFGVLGLVAFIAFVIVVICRWQCKLEFSATLGVLVSLPVCFGIFASFTHFNEAIEIIDNPRADIVSPSAAVELGMELLIIGLVESVVLAALVFLLSRGSEKKQMNCSSTNSKVRTSI